RASGLSGWPSTWIAVIRAETARSCPASVFHSSPTRRHSRTRPSSNVIDVGRPPNQAASRACSTASATMPLSRRATSASLGTRVTAATATTIPMIATTTRTSISVNALFPAADVRRTAFASARAIGPEAEHVDLAVHAGAEILVVASPRILRQALEIAALLPLVGHRRRGRPLHQRAQPLVRGGIEAVVELVELERLHDRADIRLRRDALRLVGAIHDLRDHDRGEDPEDQDHDED